MLRRGALLCSPRMDRAELVELAGRNHPMVLFNRVVPGLSVPSISVDVHGGMTQVLGTGVTAVLGYNDLVAFGALSRLQELKVVVPSDLTVVGFDDISLDRVAPTSLTTVAVSRDDLGRQAGEVLEQLLTTGHDAVPVYLPMTLRLRSTTAQPRG